MPTRKRRAPSASRAISPDSHITMSIKQIVVVMSAIVMVAGGYFYLVWNQSAASRDIGEIKTTVATVTQSTAQVSKDQDTKREQLGKDFLASTQKIADEVSTLNTAMVRQQDQTATMNDTLVTISNQLGELSRPAGKAGAAH